MRRREFMQAAGLAGAASQLGLITPAAFSRTTAETPAPMGQTSDRPNIIMFLTDDQGPWAAGCYGNPEIQTPAMDRLAAEGVRFDRCYCASPVCSPARASLLTGQMPSRTGVLDWIRPIDPQWPAPPGSRSDYLEGLTSYADILAQHGYAVGLSGKWHLGDATRPPRAFSHFFAMPEGGGPYRDPEMVRNGRREICRGYLTDIIHEDAIAFIEAHRDQPFNLNIHHYGPHAPWVGHPEELVALYQDCPFASCPQEPPHPWVTPSTAKRLSDRDALMNYFAAVTAVDRTLERLLDRLEELDLRRKTMIIFTSDNGFACGQHGYWFKGNGTFPLNMYEESVRVPAIISHPGRISAGQTCSEMISHYDFFATMLEYAGMSVPTDYDGPGRGFGDLLAGKTGIVSREVVCTEYGPVRMLRTSEWKYVHRYPYGPHELYDLVNDPGERQNLIETAAPQLLRELRHQLAAWFASRVDPQYDGARFPVNGNGQLFPISAAAPGITAFNPVPND